jgi:hypothetical protein
VRCPPQTLDEFTEYAEAFARENGEPGTLSAQVAEGVRAATAADTFRQRLHSVILPATRACLSAGCR